MATATEIAGDGGGLRHTSNGYELTRNYRITGVTGANIALALADARSALPSRGETIPGATAGSALSRLKVVEVAVNPTSDPTLYEGTVTYRKPNPREDAMAVEDADPLDPDPEDPPERTPATLTISSTLTQETTNTLDGTNLLTVVYGEVTQVAEVNLDVPIGTLTYTRRESAAPTGAVLNLVGTVNSVEYAGAGVRTLMLTNVSAQTNDGGLTYDVQYDFSYKRDTWDVLIYWIDPETGKPPPDISPLEGVAWKRIARPTADFNVLGL